MTPEVLVVSDLLNRALTRRGICAVKAQSMQAALGELQKDRFDLVLADVRMPDGGAADLLRQLPGGPESPPIVALTGAAPASVGELLVAQGAVACVQKPHSLAEMVQIVEAYLREGQSGGATRPTAPNAARAPGPGSEGARVLVAEDEEDIRRSTVAALGKAGYSVIAVADTEGALEALQVSDFALVITDLMMPGGGARRILESIDRKGLQLPVIVITGRLEQALVNEMLAAGAAACLQKPFAFSELLELAAEVLPENA